MDMKKNDQGFSENELKVMNYVSEGLSNKEIGEKLFITESSVKKYVNRILQKVELRDRTQLAIYVIKNKVNS